MRKSLAHYYAEEMYENDPAPASAAVVVPIVTKLLHPGSVLDVGCGRGVWLKEFAANGVARIIGLDGEYIDLAKLLIPCECFRPTDLSSAFAAPEGRFDLAVCIEVAEHLPARRARHLVQQLCSAAPLVLFSAAPPGQHGGGHVNCQPLSYWRALFAERGYRLLDPVRPRIREDDRVAWYYRQNIVLFGAAAAIAANPALAALPEIPQGRESEWVYMWVAESLSRPGNSIRTLGRRAWARIRRKIWPKR